MAEIKTKRRRYFNIRNVAGAVMLDQDGVPLKDLETREYVKIVPDWYEIQFPTINIVYRTAAKSNVGRIWARAMHNIVAEDSRLKRRPWAALGQKLDVEAIEHNYRRKGRGEQIYEMAKRGVLPPNQEMVDRLYKLAGYPWD